MQVIRILNQRAFSKGQQRFKFRYAFRNYGNGTVSVVRLDCILQNTDNICEHIESLYPLVIHEKTPFYYWIIETEDLKSYFGHDRFTIHDTPNDRGDECHSEIAGLTDEQGEYFAAQKCKSPDVFVCNGNRPEPFNTR